MKCNTCTHLNSPVKDCYNNDKRKCKSYDKKCCGNCTGFENEDSLGNGYCSILYHSIVTGKQIGRAHV